MAMLNPVQELLPNGVLIEAAQPQDAEEAEALWKSTGARPCAEGQPAIRLVARDAKSRRLLGVGDYFRTFPPEDVLGAVAVVPEARHHGVGAALLHELAQVALMNGRRNLAGFMAEDDAAAWRLIRRAGIPVRMYEVEGGLYCELDLVPRLQRQEAGRPC